MTSSTAFNTRDFDPRDFGACGDGQTLDTDALQSALNAAGERGGRVVLQNGTFLSGTLRLRSNVEFYVAPDAILLGAPDKDLYCGPTRKGGASGNEPRWLNALLLGEDLENLTFSGGGTIDGNNVFDPNGEEKQRGPHTILLRRCRNVTLRDLRLQHAANYAFLFYACQQVRVENARFLGGWDGIHFRNIEDEWNRDVTIEGCTFMTGDDAIAGACIERARIENCFINSSCNGLRLIGPARDFTLRNCRFEGPGVYPHRLSNRFNMLCAILVQPGAWGPWPGASENLLFQDIEMKNVQCAFQVVTRYEENPMRALTFERIRARLNSAGEAASSLESWTGEPLQNIEIRDVWIEASGAGQASARQLPIEKPGHGPRPLPVWGFYARNVDGLQLTRCALQCRDNDAREAVQLDDVAALQREAGEPVVPVCNVEVPAMREVSAL